MGVGLMAPAPTKLATAGHRRVGAHDVGGLGLQGAHARDGDALRGLGHRDDHAGVLQRQEAFRHHDVEEDGAGQGGGGDRQHQRLVAQRPAQRLRVAGEQAR